jgi:hypothetical protein
MVNSGLDLALPLYSQAVGVGQQNTLTEVHVDVNVQRQLVTDHSVQMHYIEPPPAYEESRQAQVHI